MDDMHDSSEHEFLSMPDLNNLLDKERCEEHF